LCLVLALTWGGRLVRGDEGDVSKALRRCLVGSDDDHICPRAEHRECDGATRASNLRRTLRGAGSARDWLIKFLRC